MARYFVANLIFCIITSLGGVAYGLYEVFLSCGLAFLFIFLAKPLGDMHGGIRITKKSPPIAFIFLGFLLHGFSLIWLFAMVYYMHSNGKH